MSIGGGSKSESKPRELAPFEIELTKWLMDFFRTIEENHPFEETYNKFQEGLQKITDNLENLPGDLQNALKGYIAKAGNLDNLFTNTIRSLDGISNQVRQRPAVYDQRFKNINDLYHKEYRTWRGFGEQAQKEYQDIKSQMPVMKFGNVAVRHFPTHARERLDAETALAGQGRLNAIAGLSDIQKGFMDTLAQSQRERTGISGSLIPGIVGQRTNLLGNTARLATLPLETRLQTSPLLSNLYKTQFGTAMMPLSYIQDIMGRLSGVPRSESHGASPWMGVLGNLVPSLGFSWNFG